MKRYWLNPKSFLIRREISGGATMEYIIISTFAAVISLSAVGYLTKVFKSQIDKMSNKLGVEAEFDSEAIDSFLGD